MGVIRYALNHTKKTFFDLDKFTNLDTADLPLTGDTLKLIFGDFGDDEDYKAEVIDNLLKFEAEEIIVDCNDEVPDDYVSAGGIYDVDNEYIGLTYSEIVGGYSYTPPTDTILVGRLGTLTDMTIIKDS